MNVGQRFWTKIRRLGKRRLRRERRRTAVDRFRRIWGELLEPRLTLAAPVAVNDIYGGLEDSPLTISSPGVIANDSDTDAGDVLSALLLGQAARGTVSLSANGSFTYTPAANFWGPDSFTYKLRDASGAESNTATATIGIAPVNDPPVTVNDQYTTYQGLPLTIFAPGIVANDTDPEGFYLTPQIVSPPANGFLNLLPVGGAPTGGFQYVPFDRGPCEMPFIGIDSFTYRVRDESETSNLATVTINVSDLGDPPVPIGIPIPAFEDTPVMGQAPGLLSITVPPGPCATPGTPPVTYTFSGPTSLVTPPQRGVMTVQADGSFTYIPQANFNGQDNFTFRAFNAQQQAVQVLATMVVASVNDPPHLAPDIYQSPEDTVLTVAPASGVLVNDRDVEGHTLIAQLVQAPRNGTLTDGSPFPLWPNSILPSGGFTYIPHANFHGADSFTYRASDGLAGSFFDGVVTIVVTPVNDFPFAFRDTYTINEDTPLVINAPGVLANDTDFDIDSWPLGAILAAGPAGASGSLSLNANGSFIFTPAANFNGVASFTYRARDPQGAESALASVTINVTPVNNPPVARPDAYTGTEDVELQVPASSGVLANDIDVDGPPLIAIPVAPPTHGVLALHPNGGFRYLPQLNFVGIDSFSYRASDGTLSSNLATVSLHFHGPPEPPFAANDIFNAVEDTPLVISAPGVLANDADLESEALTAALVGQALHGSVSLAPNGGFVYSPNANYFGLDSFTYRATDGVLNSNTATVVINISRIDCHCIAIGDNYTVPRNTELSVPASFGVLANDADADFEALVAILVTGPANGTLSLNTSGAFRYTPAQGFFGTESFTYRNSDGQVQSNAATVTINVTAPPNSPPLAINDSYTLGHCAVSVTLPATLGLLKNDMDVDGDSLTAILVSGPATGTLSLGASGGFTYTPAANTVGLVSITYRASDGIDFSNVATVWISPSAAPNVRPLALNDQFTATVNGALHQTAPGVLANDQDDCGNTILAAQLIAGPAQGALLLQPTGGFQFTPAAGFEGTDSFTYRANDGQQASNVATVTIAVVPVNNQPPLAVQDGYTTARNLRLSALGRGVLSNDRDPEGRPLTAGLVAGPAHGTLSLAAGGAFTYMPALNFTGSDSFTYRASDGLATSGIATVSITVAAPGENTPPVANHDQFYAIEDNSVSVSPGVLANDTDAQGDLLTTLLISGPKHGTLSLGPTGSFRYEPAANFHGVDRFTYRASDGSLSSEVATASILVFNVNDRPLALDDTYSASEGPLNISTPGILSNDSDADSDPLTAMLVSGPSRGTLSLAPNGAFLYTPAPGAVGSDSFTYQASDGLQTSRIATVTFLGPINEPPSFTKGADVAATDVSGPQTIANWATQISPGPAGEANQTLTFLLTAIRPDLFAAIPAIDSTGRLTFTPAFNVSGTAEVTVLLQDSGGGGNTSLPQTFTITINKPVPGQNSRNRLDTNDDGFISPIDAVLVINFTNVAGAGPIARPPLPGIVLDPGFYPDVDGDNFLSPIDAVLVINSLNATAAAAAGSGPRSSGGEARGGATGEGESAAGKSASVVLRTSGRGNLESQIAGADSADLGDTVLFERLALDIARSRHRLTLTGG